MRFIKDKTGQLNKYFSKLIEDYFPELKALNFLYCWYDKSRYDDENQLIVASVRKIGNRDRDLFGYDVCIEADMEHWDSIAEDDQFKIAYHELLHIKLEYVDVNEEEDTEVEQEVKVDKDGRICFYIDSHDIVLKRFKTELKIFGLSADEEKVRRFLNAVHKRAVAGKLQPLKTKGKL